MRVAQAIELQNRRLFAAAKRADRDVLASEARRQARRHGAPRLRQHRLDVAFGIGQLFDVGALERAARLHRLVRCADGREHVDDLARAAVIGVRMQRHPARQRHHPAAVQVLVRVFHPDRAPAFFQHAQHDVAPRHRKVLAFVDDDHVELPGFGQGGVGHRCFNLFPHISRRVIGRDVLRAQPGVRQHVEGRDPTAGRHQPFDVVGQRPVEADVQRAQASIDGSAVFSQRQLRLAAASGADHVQPEWREIEPPRPGGQAAREFGDHRLGVADHGARIGPQVQRVAQEARDLVEVVGALGDGQRLADHACQLGFVRCVDDVVGIDARQWLVAHDVVGAVQQVVDRQRALETLGQALDRGQDLRADLARLALVAFDQAFRRLVQKAGDLLDDHDAAIRREHDEVDVAVHRITLLDVRPVHAVVDHVGRVGQALLQVGERLDFAGGGARDGQFAPAAWLDMGHGVR